MTGGTGPLLALHGGGVGDFVLSLPTIEHVKRKYRCQVATIVARGQLADLAVRLGLADRAVDLETAGLHPVFSSDVDSQLTEQQRAWLGGFAVIVHFFGRQQSQVTRALAQACGARIHGIQPRPPTDWPGHVADFQLAQVDGPLPAPAALPQVKLVQALLQQTCGKVGIPHRSPVVVIHPGSGSPKKCWPMERFIGLAERLRSESVDVVFVLGPVERESWPAGCTEQLARAATLAPPLSLLELAALLRSAAVFVGNDSGPAHMAALLRTPVVVLFGPTDPRLWRPLGNRVVLLRAGASGGNVCDSVLPDAAAQAVLRLLRSG